MQKSAQHHFCHHNFFNKYTARPPAATVLSSHVLSAVAAHTVAALPVDTAGCAFRWFSLLYGGSLAHSTTHTFFCQTTFWQKY